MPASSTTSASTVAAGLMLPTRLSDVKRGIDASRSRSSGSVLRVRTHGCSQPSRVSDKRYACSAGDAVADFAIDVHGQQAADRRAGVFAGGEGIGPAEHQQAAAAPADELLQQRQLILREERGFDVVENHGVVLVQFLGRLGKAAAKLILVFRAETDEHGLVVLLGRFRSGCSKPRNSGLVDSSAWRRKANFGSRLGDPHQADQLEFVVLGQRAAQELELPIRPAADIEHAVRPAAAIDDDLPLVVRERGFGRLGRTACARGLRGHDRNERPAFRA